MTSTIDPRYEHLVSTFLDLYKDLEQLKDKLETTHDFKEVHRLVINRLKDCLATLKTNKCSISKHTQREAFYAMTAYTDEVMIYSEYSSPARWEDSTMEQFFFRRHTAGKVFFQKTQTLTRQYCDADQGMAALYFLCLSLGFQGEYRFRYKHKIARLQKELYRLICSSNASFPRDSKRLFPQAYSHYCRKNRQPLYRHSAALTIAIGLVTLVSGILYLMPPQLIPFSAPSGANMSATGLWTSRALLYVLSTFCLVMLIRMAIQTFSPLSKIVFSRLALSRLFSSLKKSLQRTGEHGNTGISSYLVMHCLTPTILNEPPFLRAAPPRLFHQSGTKVKDSYIVETEMGKQQFCGYNLLNQGVMIDLPFQYGSNTSRHLFLSYLLKRIRKLSTKSHLRGLLLVIPHAAITATDSDENNCILAQEVYEQVRFIQQKSCTNLPLYLVVSDCQHLQGFHRFTHSIPDRFRGQIFGWSNTGDDLNCLTEYGLSLVFEQINQRLTQILLYFFSCGEGHSGGAHFDLMHFFDGMGRLENRLAQFLKAMLAHAKPINGENLLLRGIYFIGNERIASEKVHTCFFKSLIEDKIFTETGYAKRYKPGCSERISAIFQTSRGEASL